MGPVVYYPQLRRPERLTIFRCYSKGSTFSLVILKPLSVVAVWGFNPQLPAQQECLHDVERNDTSTSKPVARQSNILNLFPYSEAVRRAAKLQNKDLSFRLALFIPTVSTSTLHSANLFLFSCHHIPTNSVPPFSSYKYTHNSQFLQLLG